MFNVRARLFLILSIFLVSLVLSPTILPGRGVTQYVPGVIGGQWALYKQLYIKCDPPNPTICGPQSISIDYGIIQIASVYNTQVTASLVLVYTNGTGTHQGILEDVDTGSSNLTGSPVPQSIPFNLLVTAKDLQAGQNVNRYSPSKFNSTISETVAGQARIVNVLNFTSYYSYQGSSSTTSTIFHFDQETGIFVSLSFSISAIYPYGSSAASTEFGMVDNNIWSSTPSTSYPDFGIDTTPQIVSTVQTSHTNSTITVTRMRGFNATVALTVASSGSGLTCTLSQTKLVKGGTDKSILSCTGAPGSYSVTITGDSGYTTHTTQSKINVGASSSSTSTTQTIQPTILGILLNPTVDIGIIAAGIIIALLALLITRRKPEPESSALGTI